MFSVSRSALTSQARCAMTGQEPVFAPAGPDAAEDEGWVLCLAYDAAENASSLVIIDAQDFSGPPVARVKLPQRVPYGAHGNWVPSS